MRAINSVNWRPTILAILVTAILADPIHVGSDGLSCFDATDGHVLAGPPTRPLPGIDLRVDKGAVFAAGMRL